jgi:hypothetical protein
MSGRPTTLARCSKPNAVHHSEYRLGRRGYSGVKYVYSSQARDLNVKPLSDVMGLPAPCPDPAYMDTVCSG